VIGEIMRQVWTPVEVKTEGHSRFGQAGTVFAVDPANEEEVVVRFDAGGQREAVKIADLQAL
jgi:hypothetical protein